MKNPSYQFLSITIRPLYDIFINEEFQKIILDYFTTELVENKKAPLYLISWEHGDNSDSPNHFQIALNSQNTLRSDNIKTALLSRLSKVGIDLTDNHIWFKCKVHPEPEGLIGYCWKEQPQQYKTNFKLDYLEECMNKYKDISAGKVTSSNIHIDNLIPNIEKYCDLMEWSKSKVDPWDVLKEFIKQGKLSFAVFKKIKREDLTEFWNIKHCGY